MNLGYACINTALSEVPKSKRITTNRSMIKRTFQEKGLAYASELALQNCQDLLKILQWNEANNIKFYRMSSDVFPWASEYELKDLPDFDDIAYALDEAGERVVFGARRQRLATERATAGDVLDAALPVVAAVAELVLHLLAREADVAIVVAGTARHAAHAGAHRTVGARRSIDEAARRALAHALFVVIVVAFVLMALVGLDVTVEPLSAVVIGRTSITSLAVLGTGTEGQKKGERKQ